MNFDIGNIEEELLKLENTPIHLSFKRLINELMNKNNLTWDDLSLLIKNLSLYFDYDDVIAELIKSWVKDINVRNNTNYKESDVNSWGWFSEIPNGMKFLTDTTDTYEFVSVKKIIFDIFLTLGQNDMMKNVTIVTATHPSSYISKMNHFQKKVQAPMQEIFQRELGIDFPLAFDTGFVTTHTKWKLDYNNAILIDDGGHNAEAVVQNNDYAYVLLLNYAHNSYLETGKRIKRLNEFDDFFLKIIQTTLESFDSRSDKAKAKLLHNAKREAAKVEENKIQKKN